MQVPVDRTTTFVLNGCMAIGHIMYSELIKKRPKVCNDDKTSLAKLLTAYNDIQRMKETITRKNI